MTRARIIVLFLCVAVFALLALTPLGAGLALSGITSLGLSARAATGTVWSGTLFDARFGPVPLGDVTVGLRPLPLLIGRAELGLVARSGTGRLVASPNSVGIGNVTARLAVGPAFAPLPLDSLDLNDVTARFGHARCEDAEGRVRANFTGQTAGLDSSSSLSGTVRCDAGELLLPLVSQSGTQRLSVRIAGNGRWRAVLSIATSDPEIATQLGAAGFRQSAGGYVLRLSGTL